MIESWLRAWLAVWSVFSWRLLRNEGAWYYFENDLTGRRWATWKGQGYSPLNPGLLRPGDIVEGPDGPREVGPEGIGGNGRMPAKLRLVS